MNREQWLTEVALSLEPLFRLKGYPVKDYRLTCGWPCRNALGKRTRRIGECHANRSSKSGISEIFISPILDEPLEVAGVISHELVHAAVGVEHQHKGLFKVACKHLGLTKGRPTEAMPGERLNDTLQRLIEKIGPYPHARVEPANKIVKASVSIKMVCPNCGCNFRMSPKWFDQSGIPTCGCGAVMENVT